MRTTVLCLCLTSLSIGCATGSSPKPSVESVTLPGVVDGSAKVYSGPDGVLVSLVQLQDQTYLVQVTGVTHRLAGLPLRCKLVDDGYSRGFSTQIDGHAYHIIRVRQPRGGGAPSYLLHLPGERVMQGVPISYDEKRSATLNTAEMLALHRKRVADGTLPELARFKQGKKRQAHEQALAEEVARMNEKCGSQVSVEVDWTTITDDMLSRLSISGWCESALDAVRQLCNRSPAAAGIVRDKLKTIRCAFGKERSIAMQGSQINWTLAEGASNNEQYAREQLATTVDWGTGRTLARVMFFDASAMCSDGKSFYVGWRPEGDPDQYTGAYDKRVFFGDGKKFTLLTKQRAMSNGWFFDPRFFAPGRNSNFRGLDYRYYSYVKIDEKKNKCEVACGKREVKLQLLDGAKAAKMAEAGSYTEPTRRVPYGLARDRRGIYYFVDRDSTPQSRDFRLYMGPVGKLRRMKMINVVSDSEGDVFSTKSGSLRLILEKENSLWIRKGRRARKLINVPIKDNLTLIYNELGPYLGEPMGTPCDVL